MLAVVSVVPPGRGQVCGGAGARSAARRRLRSGGARRRSPIAPGSRTSAIPTTRPGAWSTAADLQRFLDAVPERVVVAIDEAYHEYVDDPAYPDTIPTHVRTRPNVVVLRTFSKIYGLAGLRIGYAVAAPEIAQGLARVRPPFDVNELALWRPPPAWTTRPRSSAGAVSIPPADGRFESSFARLGVRQHPAYANFVCAAVGDGRAVADALSRGGGGAPAGPVRRLRVDPRDRRHPRGKRRVRCRARARPGRPLMARRPVAVRSWWNGCWRASRGRSPGRSASWRTAAPRRGSWSPSCIPHTGSASVAGFTGPPGVGKSSLISALVTLYRGGDQSVGVVSVDPSSPFSQGALLGDRIRLTEHFLDPGVYHPLDVHPRSSRRGGRGHPAGARGARRGRHRRAFARDRRRRPERGRGRVGGRHRRAGADAGRRRLDPGAEGGGDGDPRRDRDQQERSPGGAIDADRHPLDPLAGARSQGADHRHRGDPRRGRRGAGRRDRRAPRVALGE